VGVIANALLVMGVLLGVGIGQCSQPGLEPARRFQPKAAHPAADLLVTGG
jgi:hypothetical protein